MKSRPVNFAAAILLSLGAAATPSLAAEPRAVIELFTSQGCSSCPPADKLLGDLANDPSVIAMSLPVDYWDYLGWKDTLALHGHSNRQRAYSFARGDREVYTPQAVINGVSHVLGSDRAAIERAITQAGNGVAPLTVPVTVKIENDKVVVAVEGVANTAGADVWLCPVTAAVPVEIQRGENRGKMLTYHNVVRGWVRLGEWTGKAATFTMPLSDLPKATSATNAIDRLVVVVQRGDAGKSATKPGAMIGAATVALK